MPVSPFSRYRNLDILEVVHPRRGTTRSLPIRRQPTPSLPPRNRQHRFGSYETADLLALKYFGREELYWHLLDANRDWSLLEMEPGCEESNSERQPHSKSIEKNIRLPDDFSPGEMLVIPPLSLATRVERRIF
jgi:hypothetical protein